MSARAAEKNVAGFYRGGRFHPIRSGTVWPKGEPGHRRPAPHQSSLPYNEFKAGDFDRSRKMQVEDMTLSQYVRSQGGIRPDRDRTNEGEWRRLTARESRVRGLAFEGAKLTAEDMADSAREAGFRVPRDPNKFLEALEGDAAGWKVIHHPEWHEREAERQYMARHSNAFFTAEDERAARKVRPISEAELKRLARQDSAKHLEGKQVRHGKKEATVRKAHVASDGTILLDIGSSGRSNFVTTDDVQFINPLLSKPILKQLVSKIRAGQKLKRAYRREISLRNEIKIAKREEDEANRKAERATNFLQRRKFERAAASAYKRQVKAAAKLMRAEAERAAAAQLAGAAYANSILVRDDDEKPKSKPQLVTPAMARQMLSANVGNRPVDKNKVEAMAELMRRGIYKRQKPIVFTNELLTDGQHTLLAIIKSGVPQMLRIEHKKLSKRGRRNGLGDYKSELVGGAAAGAAGSLVGAVGGALLAPLIQKLVKDKKEKKAALGALKNPAGTDSTTAATLAAIGRARLILAAREQTAAKKPGATAAERQKHQASARTYTQQGLELLQRAGAAYPVQGNPYNIAPAAVEKFHREFRGFPTSGEVTPYYAPFGLPSDAPFLGQLHKIILADGRELTFEDNPAALLGTIRGRRRLVIGLSNPYRMPPGYDADARIDYGEVVEVQYVTPKPHLYDGDFTEKLFFHELGEEGGQPPHLILQNGRLSFHGGSYTIKREGIRN